MHIMEARAGGEGDAGNGNAWTTRSNCFDLRTEAQANPPVERLRPAWGAKGTRTSGGEPLVGQSTDGGAAVSYLRSRATRTGTNPLPLCGVVARPSGRGMPVRLRPNGGVAGGRD